MKYPGQPELPPSWYEDREQSFIEEKFSKELGDLADLIEQEKWFGDPEKHSRYRVDFILKDARLIVELDGHDYHSTKEQTEKDAIRQRYLSRAGYTVIRFTGREVYRSPAACVSELREIYNERMQRAPAKYRAMYIDYRFLIGEMSKAKSFYQDLHKDKSLSLPAIDKFIPHAIEWLHEKSLVTAFVFHFPEDTVRLSDVDGMVVEYAKGEVRVNTISAEHYSRELGNHLMSFSHLFDEFYLIGDDSVYIEPLRSVLPLEFSEQKMGNYSHMYLSNGKLLRRCNDETSFVGTDIAHMRWQDVWYPIGTSMGLGQYEL